MYKLAIALAAALLCTSALAEVAQESSVVTDNAAAAENSNAQNITFNQPAGTGKVDYSGSYELNNVPAVSAPSLATTLSETCMGSTSAGFANSGLGLSFGTTWRDGACVRRLDSRQIQSLGYVLAAKERMCDDEKNAAAFYRAGKTCYNDLPDEQKRPADRKGGSTATAQKYASEPSQKPAAVKYSNDTDQEQSGWAAYQALTGN